MDDHSEQLIADVMRSLSNQGQPISKAAKTVPDSHGLYALHGLPAVWSVLGLDRRPAGVPLYVGKGEDSLITRDLKTHFAVDPLAAPRTGSSTVRRSFAALLREQLDLRGVPRNKLSRVTSPTLDLSRMPTID